MVQWVPHTLALSRVEGSVLRVVVLALSYAGGLEEVLRARGEGGGKRRADPTLAQAARVGHSSLTRRFEAAPSSSSTVAPRCIRTQYYNISY